MIDLPRPLAVVAHDAGAANIILAWLPREPLVDVRAVMEGPAAALWAARFGTAPLAVSIEHALDGAATLLTGTGWASDLEHRARLAAKARGIASVAVIDHWVNYRARFSRDGVEILPDRLWVTDDEAVAEARRTLSELPVEAKPNFYLDEQAAAAGPVPVVGDILFVAEPARSDWGRGIPGEFQALDALIEWRACLDASAQRPIRLRPHPSDPAGKYDAWLAEQHAASLDTAPDIGTALREAAVVAGMNSFALVVALAAGRRAISVLPPWAPPCVLPHRAIERLLEG